MNISCINIFKVNFNKCTIQWPMGHTGDDAVHKNTLQNEHVLAESAKKFCIGLIWYSL